MVLPRRLFAKRLSAKLVTALPERALTAQHPLTMSLRLAFRAARLARQIPARQAAVGIAQATRGIHSSKPAKGKIFRVLS